MSKTSKANMMSKLRIISGMWRGRKIDFQSDGIRPTSDRIRETVFNWLQFDIAETVCLDLFAGSGAMGIEALSRGANSCTFVDSNPAVLTSIEENISRFDPHGDISYETVCGDYERVSQQLSGLYNIIFIDPPYAYPLAHILSWCQKSLQLSSNALIYIESDVHSAPWQIPEQWDLIKFTKTKRIAYGVCKVSNDCA